MKKIALRKAAALEAMRAMNEITKSLERNYNGILVHMAMNTSEISRPKEDIFIEKSDAELLDLYGYVYSNADQRFCEQVRLDFEKAVTICKQFIDTVESGITPTVRKLELGTMELRVYEE